MINRKQAFPPLKSINKWGQRARTRDPKPEWRDLRAGQQVEVSPIGEQRHPESSAELDQRIPSVQGNVLPAFQGVVPPLSRLRRSRWLEIRAEKNRASSGSHLRDRF